MPKLSIVVPVYYNEDNLRPLYADLKEKLLDRDNPLRWRSSWWMTAAATAAIR